LPRRFVYLPNQFWAHKNHKVVVQALALAKAQGSQVTVVCTGSAWDHRNPWYFSELLATISELGLRDNLILLGFIPHAHLFQLMRQSLAVLQPSLFEGWSTTVEEAKSVGKSVILSDIPVHREQNPPQVTFFDPRDPKVLADCLVKVFDQKRPGPDHELEASARASWPLRAMDFGRAFVEIVQDVVQR
jgi:glycosyltransferase involved in cell wall biosynthesis